MAAVFIQSATSNGTVSPQTPTFSSTTTNGNLIVVAISESGGNAASITGVTDTFGNTYTQVPATALIATVTSVQAWYAYNIVGGASHAVNVAFNTGIAARISVTAQEFSGFGSTDPYDVSVGATGTSTTPSSGATGTTSQADSLVVGFLSRNGNASSLVSVGAGYSNFATSVSASEAALESKNVAVTGTQTATFNLSISRQWACIAAVFKAYTAPPPATASSATNLLMGV